MLTATPTSPLPASRAIEGNDLRVLTEIYQYELTLVPWRATLMMKASVKPGFDSGIGSRGCDSVNRRVHPSLLMSSGWIRVLLAMALTGAIWGLVFSVLSG